MVLTFESVDVILNVTVSNSLVIIISQWSCLFLNVLETGIWKFFSSFTAGAFGSELFVGSNK